jgi:hypothetical protein
MIPTRSKAKIPGAQSYPVKAKEISDSLAGTPQAGMLSIEFHDGWKSRSRSGNPYHSEFSLNGSRHPKVLEVAYGWVPKDLPGSEPAFQRGWLIVVLPVPRELRHKVNELIKQQALPAIIKWLFEHRNLSSSSLHGTQAIKALYDRERETILLEYYQSQGETFQAR